MIGRQEILWFSIGFAASAVAVVMFGAEPARAQSRFDTTVQPAPQPALGNQRPRQRQRAIPRPPLDNEELVVVPRAPRRDGPQEDGDPDVPETADNSNGNGAGNGNGQRRAAAQRTPGTVETPQDGDLSFPREPEQQPDGLPIETTNPDDPNADPGQVDARFREDVDAFERPAAGYDALAFQIEDMEPLLDERPLRLFRFEPYDPIGIRKGSFVVFPALEIAGFATNNLTGAGPRKGASALELTPSVRAVSDWRRHAMEFRATGLATFFNEDSSQNDRAYALETRGRLDISRRTNIEVLAVSALSQEGRTARDAVDSAVGRTDIHTNRIAAAFNHRFNRLSVQLRGSLTDVDYDGVRTNTGGFVTNAERDVTSKEVATRATWQFKPALAGFAEVGIVNRDFKAPAADGITRDSNGERLRFGVAFGSSSQYLRGEVSAGWDQQRPSDSRLGSVSGLLLDANLAYRMSALTTFLLTANTDIVESFGPSASGGVERQFGLEARHAFKRHIIGTAATRLKATDFNGSGLKEREYVNELGLEYFFNREITIFGRYAHTIFDSSAPGGDYTSDAVRIGMRIRK